MGQNTRYDTLRNRIRTRFTRSKTFEVELTAGSGETVFDVDDTNFVGNDSFLEYGPYNHVRVRVVSGEAKIFTRKNRESFVNMAATGAAPVNAVTNDETGQRYIGYLRAEETSGVDPVTLEIQASIEVDSTELDLLKMSGLLNVQE